MRSDIINLAAGPSPLPLPVLEEAARGLIDYNNSGMGICEISHRSKAFESLLNSAQDNLRTLLQVPQEYSIIFLQGGGLTQFAMTALNMLAYHRVNFGLDAAQLPEVPAEYIITGSWSAKAASEAKKLGLKVHAVTDSRSLSKDNKSFGDLAAPDSWEWPSPKAQKPAFVYYCSNETVNGVEIDPPAVPSHLQDVPVVCDMSSNIMSKPIPWTSANFGIIYAGAQKNIGPPGVTLAFVRKDLLIEVDDAVKLGGPRIPSMLSYKVLADNNSLFNTPPTFSIYVAGLVFKHLLQTGGLEVMTKTNEQKAALIYSIVDNSNGFYIGRAAKHVRSRMNVVFVLKGGEDAEKQFIEEADKVGIKQIKGHRSVGGIRTSLYNAVSLEQTERLAVFMREFQNRHS